MEFSGKLTTEDLDEDRVRIISARTATRRETHAHQERGGK
jgi:uncharacterized DUF497 family protein